MSRHFWRACDRGAGFSMVELLVTIIIAAIFFAAAVPLFANAAKATSSDQMRVAAQSIAQQKLEQIRGLDFNKLVKLTDGSENLTTWMGGQFNPAALSYSGASAKAYTVGYTIVFTPTNAAPTDAQYAHVTVDVSWADVSMRGAARPTRHVVLSTVISRQFSGPSVKNVTLSPINGLKQLTGSPTTITVYISPQDAGTNNSSVGSVKVIVSDFNNATFVRSLSLRPPFRTVFSQPPGIRQAQPPMTRTPSPLRQRRRARLRVTRSWYERSWSLDRLPAR